MKISSLPARDHVIVPHVQTTQLLFTWTTAINLDSSY